MSTPQTQRLSLLAGRSRQPSVDRGARCITRVIAAAFVLLVLPATGRADWEALGGSLNAVNAPESIDLTQEMASVGGTPWVAWVEPVAPPGPTMAPTRLRVASWDGTSWVRKGSDLNIDPALSASMPSIANVGGVPYVAWVQKVSGGTDLRVARWNATTSAWDLVGGPLEFGSPNAGGAGPMIRSIDGIPYVSFFNLESPSQHTIRVKRWNGTTWVSVGDALATNPGGFFLERAAITAAGGEVYAAWTQRVLSGGLLRDVLFTARFDGTSWVDTGSPALAGATDRYFPSMADLDGSPGVAWLEAGASGKLQLRVAVLGVTWNDVGPVVDDDVPYPITHSLDGLSLLEIGGVPHVAWGQDQPVGDLRVAQFAGGAWSLVVSPLRRDPTAGAGQPSLADLDGYPGVAWRELTSLSELTGENTYEVHASRIAAPPPPPLETIITGNSTATNAGVASFAFTAAPPAGATFECSLDGEAFADCSSPYTSPVIAPGAHTFEVRASNATGTDPTPARRDFIVDRVAPTTTIRLDGNQVPSGAFGGSVTVNADVTDPPLSSGIRSKLCLIDPLTPPTSFGNFGSQPCGVVVTAVGTHTAYAIANDQAGNESAIVRATFTIVAAPDTTITDGPSGVVFSVPTFRFTSNVAGARFECRIDSGPYTACSSAVLGYKVFDLSQGTHTFEVRAIGPDGLVDPSPASRTFTIGTQALDGGCSFRFPFMGNDDNLACVVKRTVCPLGSVCTRVGDVSVVNEDIGISYAGVVGYPESELIPRGSTTEPASVDYSCWTPSLGGTFTGGPCPRSWTNTVIGKGQSIAIVCGTYRLGSYSSPLSEPLPGPDEARGIICNGTITIRPATALEAAPTGTGTGVGIVVPGPGILGIAPASVRARSAAAGRAAPKPPFKTITSKIKGEGVKELKLNLGPAERKTLRTQRRLELTLEITFTPTDGESVSRTETVVLTTRCKPTKKRPFC